MSATQPVPALPLRAWDAGPLCADLQRAARLMPTVWAGAPQGANRPWWRNEVVLQEEVRRWATAGYRLIPGRVWDRARVVALVLPAHGQTGGGQAGGGEAGGACLPVDPAHF